MKKSYISLMLFGEGWAEKLAEPTDQHDLPPNKHVTVKVGTSLYVFDISVAGFKTALVHRILLRILTLFTSPFNMA